MLRSRKKDLNLRPNRVLDKRSSRGMLYENEELRLRTIHINEEVDKSQSNIKKLKKENEVLKREIWALRDECEKLEGMLKKITKAVEQNGGDLEALGLVSLSGTAEESGENSTLAHHNLSRRMSKPEGFHRRSSALSGMSGISFYDSEDEELEDLQMMDEDGDSGSSEPQGVRTVSEVHCSLATTESQTVSTEDLVNPNTYVSSPPSCSWQQFTSVSPELEVVKEESESNYNTNSNSHNSPAPLLLKSQSTTDAPTIEITPAPFRNGTGTSPSPELSKHDLKYIMNSSLNSIDDSHDRLSPIPFDEDSNDLKFSHRKKSFSESHGGEVVMNSSTQSNFPEFYRSEPNLVNLVDSEIPNFDLSDRRVSVTRRLSNASAIGPKIPKSNENWSAIDKNVVIGYIDLGNGIAGIRGNPGQVYVLRDLRPQEIIDELEAQFDPTLHELVGVRMLGSGPTRIFISLRSALGVQRLLQTGLKLREGKVIVRLVDASKKCSLVVLAGLPPDLSDSNVISVLNQFGQVVSPLERRSYKGVDISERLARMHLIAKVPTSILISGYEVPAKICHCLPQTTSPPEPDKDVLPSVDVAVEPKLHRRVTRTLSSAPRLEGQSMVPAFKGSIEGNVTKSPSKISLVSLSNPVKKQQLQRIPRSSPGSLTIPQSEGEGQSQTPVEPNKTFYRSFSFDPRRRSSTSRIGITTMTVQTTEPSSRQPLNNDYASIGRTQLQNQASNHSSQLNPHEMNRRGLSEKRKKESVKSLPWCGCWGNGLI